MSRLSGFFVDEVVMFQRCGRAWFLAIVFFGFLYPPAARAELILDLEVRAAYDSNVVGILSDSQPGPLMMPQTGMVSAAGFGMGPGSPSYIGSSQISQDDFSVILYGAVGAFTEISSDLSLFIKASGERTSYSTYDEFDSTIGAVTAGMNSGLSRSVTLYLSCAGKIKTYEDPARDSNAVLGAVSIKYRPGDAIWVRTGYEYEDNDADTPSFTYTGNTGLFWLGFALGRTAELQFGYEYLVREFDDPVVTDITAHTFSGGIVKKLGTHWYLDAFVDRQLSDSNVPDTATSNTTVSVGVRFSL
jgi:hypothetical protein